MEDRLVGLLGVYGLTEREARIFVFLTKNGACGAGELAKALDIRRMEAYRLLKRLLDRGVVVSTAGKPIKYQAETIDGVLSLLTDEQRRTVKKMDDARPELLEQWRMLPRGPKESFEQRFRIIQGREQIYSTVSKMVEGAASALSLQLSRNDMVQVHLLGVGDKLQEAEKRGVKVELATLIDPSTVQAVEAAAKHAEVRHSEDAARSRLVLADGVQTLVSLVLDDTKGMKNDRDVAIWTDSRDYAEMMGALYQTSFSRAEDGVARIASVKDGMKFAERVSKVVDVVKAALADRGWEVEAPGTLRGASGGDFQFDAVLRGKAGRTFGLDVVFGTRDSPVGERVTASATKKVDRKDARELVVSTPMADVATAGLANLLGATRGEGSDLVGAAAAVRSSVEEAA